MKIQFVSDLHLEYNKGYKNMITPSAPILCLNGDICACGIEKGLKLFIEFLSYYKDKFDYILHIAGNHEYYGNYKEDKTFSYIELNEIFKNLNQKFYNYYFLNNDIFQYKDAIFLGTTLWTNIPQKAVFEIDRQINDYVFIKYSRTRYLQVSDVNKFHQDSVKYIEYICKKYPEKKIILLTHHKPIWEENKYSGDVTKHAYETDLRYLLKSPIKICIFGHTHEHMDITTENGVRILSNTLGFEKEKINFKKDKVITLF